MENENENVGRAFKSHEETVRDLESEEKGEPYHVPDRSGNPLESYMQLPGREYRVVMDAMQRYQGLPRLDAIRDAFLGKPGTMELVSPEERKGANEFLEDHNIVLEAAKKKGAA